MVDNGPDDLGEDGSSPTLPATQVAPVPPQVLETPRLDAQRLAELFAAHHRRYCYGPRFEDCMNPECAAARDALGM